MVARRWSVPLALSMLLARSSGEDSGPWIRKRTGSGKYPAANCWTNGWFNWKTSQTDALVPAPTPGSTSKNDRKSSGFGCRTGVEYEGTKITEIDDDVTIKEIDTTECFVGNELYSSETAFCDRKCASANQEYLDDDADDADYKRKFSKVCGGPWYCSKTEICVDTPYGNSDRTCTYVKGCSNATQCTTDDGVNIASFGYPDVDDDKYTGWFSQRGSQRVKTQRFGGVTTKTYCCENYAGDDFKYAGDESAHYTSSSNMPCNAASGIFGRLLIAVPPLVALLMRLW